MLHSIDLRDEDDTRLDDERSGTIYAGASVQSFLNDRPLHGVS